MTKDSNATQAWQYVFVNSLRWDWVSRFLEICFLVRFGLPFLWLDFLSNVVFAHLFSLGDCPMNAKKPNSDETEPKSIAINSYLGWNELCATHTHTHAIIFIFYRCALGQRCMYTNVQRQPESSRNVQLKWNCRMTSTLLAINWAGIISIHFPNETKFSEWNSTVFWSNCVSFFLVCKK